MPEDQASPDPGSAPDGGGDFSQDDIDALLAGGGAADSADAPSGDEPASAPGEDAQFSQDDIDALLAGGGEADSSGGSTGAASAGELTQEDIDAALREGGWEPEPQEADTRVDATGRPFDDTAAAMAAAIEADKAAAVSAGPAPEALDLPDLSASGSEERLAHEIDLLHDVNLGVKIELGRTRMVVEDVLQLGEGSVVELDKLAGDPVDVFANGRLIARGEVLVLNDNFCVRISEIMSGARHAAAG